MAVQNKVSLPVIKRLPKYYRYLTNLSADGKDKISSSELAHMMGTTASQVRQDYNCFGGFGQQGIKGFWNFSHYDLSVEYPDVTVENVHLGDSLMSLGYRLRNQEK